MRQDVAQVNKEVVLTLLSVQNWHRTDVIFNQQLERFDDVVCILRNNDLTRRWRKRGNLPKFWRNFVKK